ncbi:MAG: tetratricopeptide repeat protein [Persicimonas sp.]
MYNLLIALGVGAVTTLALGFLVGGGSFSVLYGIIPGIIAAVVTYIFLARRTMKQVQALAQTAQQQLQNQNTDRAVEILKSGYPLGKWQFFVKSQIDAQIGTILYVSKNLDQAESYLKNAFAKNWTAQGMLGVLYYKRRKFDEMEEVFEQAVQANKKQALLWNLYAYCLWKSKQRDKAIDVLNRALDKLDGYKQTERNLKALKNGRKMKMRSWNQLWYQFHLDRMPQQRQRVQFR